MARVSKKTPAKKKAAQTRTQKKPTRTLKLSTGGATKSKS